MVAPTVPVVASVDTELTAMSCTTETETESIALFVSPPPEELTTTVYDPMATVDARLTVRVEVPDVPRVMLVGLSVDVSPDDCEKMLSVMVPVNGEMAVIVTVDVIEVPGAAF